jgi:DNA-binding NarL/FixJ family response regulator
MQTAKKVSEAKESESITVLLIEDSMDDGIAITKACVEGEMYYDFKIVRKYTLEGGLDYLMAFPVDVVLLDLGLPDARELKAVTRIHNLYPDLAIVIISGYSNVSMIQDALKSGAQEFLIKGESSAPTIRQSLYQAIARKKIERAYQKGEKLS